MKKTYPLNTEGKNRDRLLDAIKHDIRKYVARQRRVPVPSVSEARLVWMTRARRTPNAATRARPGSTTRVRPTRPLRARSASPARANAPGSWGDVPP